MNRNGARQGFTYHGPNVVRAAAHHADPFAETRDYVKILTRNVAIYRGLYGG